MQIRIRQTGQVMYEEAFRQHIQQNGGPTWGITTTEILNELGADVVFDGPQPTLTPPYQIAVPNGVVEENGQWYTSFIAGPVFFDTPATDTEPARTASQNEIAYQAQMDATQATSVRAQRDDKLAKCDWTQVVDNPLANKAAWATYRQTLRDLTKETGFPWTMTWPTDPTGAK